MQLNYVILDEKLSFAISTSKWDPVVFKSGYQY